MYIPTQVNTSHITLSNDLKALAEVLAKNTHDVWATGRMREGWVYGEVRDDIKKTHPCLVPYEDLPESEKEYDRSTSLETLKVIVSLGYVINKG